MVSKNAVASISGRQRVVPLPALTINDALEEERIAGSERNIRDSGRDRRIAFDYQINMHDTITAVDRLQRIAPRSILREDVILPGVATLRRDVLLPHHALVNGQVVSKNAVASISGRQRVVPFPALTINDALEEERVAGGKRHIYDDGCFLFVHSGIIIDIRRGMYREFFVPSLKDISIAYGWSFPPVHGNYITVNCISPQFRIIRILENNNWGTNDFKVGWHF